LFIERMQVEEGFLDGFDLSFRPGLNVLIGPRGAGKTSVIELIRFCLKVPAFTNRAQEASEEHALSVLKGGQVTLTLDVGGQRLVVERSADEKAPRVHPDIEYSRPTILSQREIEQIGLDAAGRLRLIDGFRSTERREVSAEDRILGLVRSVTQEIRDLSSATDGLLEALEGLRHVPDALEEAAEEEQAVLESMESTRVEQDQLKSLTSELTASAVRSSTFERIYTDLGSWTAALERVADTAPEVGRWPDEAETETPLAEVERAVAKSRSLLSEAIRVASEALTEVRALADRNTESQLAFSEEARQLRRKLEEAQKGAGAVSKRVSDLRQQVASIDLLRKQVAERQARIVALQRDRHGLLDELDQLRESRHASRMEVVRGLRDELGPKIDVRVQRYGMQSEYVGAIIASLQGSRLHYSVLAPRLAAALSPRELVEAIETNDLGTLQERTDLNEERAERLTSAIREHGTGSILTAPVEDAVELLLLDGTDYKSSEAASTGQRCTMVLPILLEHKGQVLVVDQPEDHLDNSFIVDTVIQAIRNRAETGQLIFATHNANIPVLGDAHLVVALDSDGQRGFYRSAAELENPESVRAISTIMEGGAEAFERRAQFYRERLDLG
jgi:DNA repair ATPase RecN